MCKYKIFIGLIFLFLCIDRFCLIEARYQKKSFLNPHKMEKIKKKKNTFDLFIEGIECERCKQAACTILEDMGACADSFHVTMSDESRIMFAVPENMVLDPEIICTRLDKEGFVFKKLIGYFKGSVTTSDDCIYFVCAQSSIRFKLKNHLVQSNKIEVVRGEISYNPSDTSFWLSLI